MAEPMDPNIEALDPSIRALRKAQARETIGTVGRVLRGEPEPPRPDYTDQRIKLIGLLDNLRKMETDLRAEKEKTGRVSLAAEATLMKAIAGLGEANIGAVSDVEVARLNAYTKRLEDLGAAIERSGIRRPEQLKEAAVSSLNALGAYTKNGAITPGQEVAFATEVLKGLRSIDTTNPADAGLVSVYADELQNRYGILLEDFIATPGTSANVAPATITSIATALQRGETAQVRNAEFEQRQELERDKIYNETIGPLTLQPGSWLGKQLSAYEKVRGGTAAAVETPPPPVTATLEEKQAYLQSINPALTLDSEGKTVTLEAGPDGPTRSFSYETLVRMGADGAPRLMGVSMTDFLDQQEKYVLKELARLETASDLESVQLRNMILKSPELATWAQENGYAEFRPEQQFKALLAARRGEVAEQNKAFRAKLDADILSREGAPIRQAGAAIRDLFRRPDEKVAPGARRSREDSADITGGATTPAGKTEATGATESDPKKWSEGDAPRADGIYPPVSMQRIDVEGERAASDEELAAKTQKMAAGSAARPERTLPADTAFGDALARGRNERTVQRTLSNADPTKFGDIAKQYEAIQSFKSTDPRAYATALAGLAREVNRRGMPTELTAEGGGAETGTMAEGRLPIAGMGKAGFAMEEGPALEEARRQYREAQAAGEQTRAIPQGRRGFITGPSAEDVAAINASLPPIDTTDVPEPPVEGPVEEGVDTLPPPPEGTAVAEAEPDMTDTLLQQEVSGAETPALPVASTGEAQAAAAPKAKGGAGRQMPQSTPPRDIYDEFGRRVQAETEAAATAMAQAQSAEEQARARRKALLMGTPMPA